MKPISLAPLRARWERQARRIDALSLRERAILFLGIVAVLAALFDTLVLSPLAARARLRTDALAGQQAELAQLRAQFVAASQDASDPTAALRAQLQAAQAERAQLDAQLRQLGSGAGESLSAVLQRLLSQQPGLVLERLVLLDEPPLAVQPAASAPAAVPGVRWQGVELQVQGGYREVQRYLQALERELPALRWGEMHLNAGSAGEPPRLRAQLFLLKVPS